MECLRYEPCWQESGRASHHSTSVTVRSKNASGLFAFGFDHGCGRGFLFPDGTEVEEEARGDPTDSSSQPMWALMQQQMEQLRGQMGDGLNKNISLLTEQLRSH